MTPSRAGIGPSSRNCRFIIVDGFWCCCCCCVCCLVLDFCELIRKIHFRLYDRVRSKSEKGKKCITIPRLHSCMKSIQSRVVQVVCIKGVELCDLSRLNNRKREFGLSNLLSDSNTNVNSMINRRVSLFYRYPLKAFHHMVCPCT